MHPQHTQQSRTGRLPIATATGDTTSYQRLPRPALPWARDRLPSQVTKTARKPLPAPTLAFGFCRTFSAICT